MDTIARQLDAARHQFKTTYSRQGMEANIVHIGFGAFHRGHQAVYNDLTNEITGNRWGMEQENAARNGGELASLPFAAEISCVTVKSASFPL